MCVALQIFEQFCPKAGDANTSVATPETDFNAKLLFKVIYFGIIEEPPMGYIAQYNVALDVKVRKIERAKEAKIAFFDHPTFI